MQSLYIVGSSGQARVIVDIVRLTNEFECRGYLDREVRATDLPTLGYTDYLANIPGAWVFIAVGDNALRMRLAEEVRSFCPTARFATLVHPSAMLAKDVVIGEGSCVMAGAVIQTGARVGRHCIINTRVSIDHDCTIEDFASVAPGATLGGGVHIGTGSAIGLGASVKHRIRIGKDSVIGLGAAVIDDIPECVVSLGVPSRTIRSRNRGDAYLN